MTKFIKEQHKKLKKVKAKEKKWVDSVVAQLDQESESDDDDGVSSSPKVVTENKSKNKNTKKI